MGPVAPQTKETAPMSLPPRGALQTTSAGLGGPSFPGSTGQADGGARGRPGQGPTSEHARQVGREDYLSEPPWPRSAGSPGQSRRPAASTGSGEATGGDSEDPFLAGRAGLTWFHVQGCPVTRGGERGLPCWGLAGSLISWHLKVNRQTLSEPLARLPWTPALLSGGPGSLGDASHTDDERQVPSDSQEVASHPALVSVRPGPREVLPFPLH